MTAQKRGEAEYALPEGVKKFLTGRERPRSVIEINNKRNKRLLKMCQDDLVMPRMRLLSVLKLSSAGAADCLAELGNIL